MSDRVNAVSERKETFKQQFFVPDPFVRSGGLWPLNFGQTWTKPGYSVGPRVIEYYNLHFVLDGQVKLQYADQSVLLTKGDVFAMLPNIVYRYGRSESNNRLHMSWISFDGPQAYELMHVSSFTVGAPYLRQIMNTELDYTLRQLHLVQKPDARRQIEIVSLLYRMFSQMIRPDSALKPAGQDVWLPRSVVYMQTHYMERITVQDVADYMSLHRGYFSKVFTERMGLSPIKYLHKLRMDKAAELLREGTLSIEEVALTLGYPDPYSFNHAFSKYHGMPPGKWRALASHETP
jgi:AraC-like DNA-binding protein